MKKLFTERHGEGNARVRGESMTIDQDGYLVAEENASARLIDFVQESKSAEPDTSDARVRGDRATDAATAEAANDCVPALLYPVSRAR